MPDVPQGMTNEELALVFKVGSGIIGGLLLILGFFLVNFWKEAKEVRLDVQKILVIIGVLDNDIKATKEDQSFMRIKMGDNDNRWTELYQKYDLQLKK